MRIRPSQIKSTVTRVVTTPYAIQEIDEVIFVNPDSLGANITVNLPSGIPGEHYKIVHTGDNHKVFVSPLGIETLFGDAASFKLNRGEAIDLNFDAIEGWW